MNFIKFKEVMCRVPLHRTSSLLQYRLGSNCAEKGLGVLREHKQGAMAGKVGDSILGFINRIIVS